MFYLASKVFWFALQPSSLLLAALGLAIIALKRQHLRSAWRWLTGGLAGIAICGLTALPDLLLLPLETRFQRATPDKVDGIVVLGGIEDGRSSSDRELMALGEAAERLTEAAALARRHPKARVVISGGSDEVLRSKTPEAERAQKLLLELGIEPHRILVEPRSRNTAENATFSRAIAQPTDTESWLLITSAWHMPRAIGCFRNAGFAVLPWPVDYRTPAPFDILRFNANIGEGLRRLDFAAKEWIGLLVYRLTGRTDALLPRPA